MIEKVVKILKENNGYVTTGLLEEKGVLRQNISYLISKNIIRKVSYGIYMDANLIEDEYYILQLRYRNIVYSHNTAFHLLNLSDRAPYILDITTIHSKTIDADVNVHYVMEDKLNIGVIEVKSPYGNLIKVYNAERCICDMLKNQSEYDIELYNKIIKSYFSSKEKNLILLDEYAKIFNVYEKLTNIMEVLID